MTFMPRMTAEIRRIQPVRPLQVRRLDGVVADLWHARGQSGGGGFYVSPDPRVVVFLDEPGAGGAGTGDGTGSRSGADAVCLRTEPRGAWVPGVRALFVPPNVPLWSEIRAARDFTHLDLHFQADALARRMGGAGVPAQPRLHNVTDRIQPIARLLAAEVAAPRRPDLMMDALLTALMAEVFDLPADAPDAPGAGDAGRAGPHKGGLPPAKLRRLASHVRDNLHRPIGVAELAELAGVSPSWFQRAFKSSVDETPQRWVTGIRLQAAREQMRDDGLRLADIAAATGFSDQAHLTRTFRAAYGQTPSQWRRDQDAGTGTGPETRTAPARPLIAGPDNRRKSAEMASDGSKRGRLIQSGVAIPS
ncbi:helix-turn-helix transcriptional regulator [Marinibacterium sp. SX1]|uniref:helix-turn-helix transcriptional regulator n=1 Tax=Marinibacterium sp. SX1 TaxID=3388424 RepID=UPI003D1744D2